MLIIPILASTWVGEGNRLATRITVPKFYFNMFVLLFTEEMDESAGESSKVEVTTAIKILSQKMEDLQLCSNLITKHGNALQKALSELESLDSACDMTSKIKAINEKATLYRIASSRMINVSWIDYKKILMCKYTRILYLRI